MKGLISYYDDDIPKNHKVSSLLNTLKSNNIDNELISILEKYVGENPSNSIIKEFIEINNNFNSNNIHINIRYPEGKQGETDFSPLRYQTEDIIPKLESIVLNIDTIKDKSLKIVRK
ncbi:hypothetical protein [Paraclostridium dentum]|uniref:hypothetical protein n=1 Tax=Paraclostridium dentum TaxID=2662455 RepID=UPI003B00CF82